MATNIPRNPFVSIDDLFPQNRTNQVHLNRHLPSAGPATAFATGFHLYTQIGLTLPIAAAEDDASAQRYLDVLADYALIGEAAAAVCGARLLEVQGDRLHFLVEEPTHSIAPNAVSWQRLLTLAHSVVNTSYEQLARKAGDHWKGCQAAADFGPAALLYSHIGGGSIVSLGNPANTPAKRLGQQPSVPAGYLAIPEALALKELAGSLSRRWLEINLRDPNDATREFLTRDLSPQMGVFLANQARSRPVRPLLKQAAREFFDALGSGGTLNPTRVQGFCFRADLDGFTKQVQAAFAAGHDAIMDLVRRFHELLDFPLHFEKQLRARTVILPWAGDCATILLLPPYNESMSSARSELPVKAALQWHQAFGTEKRFSQAITGARWTLGMAAGDEDEGNDGRMIVADLPAAGRTYRVAAGWAAQRSGDAYQYDGVSAGDTVITRIDRNHLWSAHAESFKDLSSIFAKATIEALQKASAQRLSRAALSVAAPSSVSMPLPPPRPFGYE